MTKSSTSAHPDHRGHLERFARRGTASLVGAAFSSVFGVVVVVIITNGYPTTLAGVLFASTASFLILESVALLGADTGLVRWMPAQIASGRGADLFRTVMVAGVPVLGLAVALSVAGYLTAPSLAPHLAGADSAATMSTMLRALALMLPFAAISDLLMAATRGAGTMRATVFVDNIGRLGLQCLAVLVTYLAGGGGLALALAWSLPYAVSLVVAAFWLQRLVARRTARAREVVRPWRTLGLEFWGYTAPRAIAQVTQAALKKSDIVLVAALASPADAALYTAATRFIVLGQLFVQSVQQALAPQVASLFAAGETRAANSVYQAAARWSMTASWPLYLVLAGFAPTVMAIFGEGYAAASDVVVILSLTMLWATACGPVDSVLLMAGRSWLSLRNASIALAVNIGLNLLLIPLLGIRGAAISWAVAIVVRNLLPLIQVKRQLDMWPATRSAVQVGLLALACFGSVDVVVVLTGWPVVVDVMLLTVSSVVYLAVVWNWRHRLGLDAFRAVLRRRVTPQATTPLPTGS